jgi:two-component system response regulator HydG
VSQRSVLLVDDEPESIRILTTVLERDGWRVWQATDGRGGIEMYERVRPDIVITDLQTPGLNGLQALHILRQRDPDASVIVVGAASDAASIVDAIQLGAENYLAKPVDADELREVTSRAAETAQQRRRNRGIIRCDSETTGLAALGTSPKMRAVANQVRLMADGVAPVLLLGESGTGKGWVAQTIHSLSPRANAPFVELNCAALTANFLESELFGHEKGAFTDARTMKRGLFEVAHQGTIFLDEVGDLAPELQPKLLKVLERGRFRRIGGTQEIEVDVRVIAATNIDLTAAAETRHFRPDLFYRLSVLPLTLPSLRDRGRDEIADLAFRLLADLRRRANRGPTMISAPALALILRYRWPGNIRQLRNLLERVLVLAGEVDEILPEHLPLDLHGFAAVAEPGEERDGDLSLASAERIHIGRVLAHFGGNRVRAAEALGITRTTLYKRLRDYGLERVGRN